MGLLISRQNALFLTTIVIVCAPLFSGCARSVKHDQEVGIFGGSDQPAKAEPATAPAETKASSKPDGSVVTPPAAAVAVAPDDNSQLKQQLIQSKATIAQMSARIDSLQEQIRRNDEELLIAKNRLDTFLQNQAPQTPASAPAPAEGHGTQIQVPTAKTDPQAGFSHDAAVQAYRKALVYFDSQKYPEAVLAFSAFLERYPDHALAGNAQFYVGESYFKQHEYKLASQEFKRVLTSYDRSAHVAETLRDLAESEDAQNLGEEAAKHRQLLMSLFPNSPAASFDASARKHTPPVAVEPNAMDEAPEAGVAEKPAVAPAATGAAPVVEPNAMDQDMSGAALLDEPPSPGAIARPQPPTPPTAPMGKSETSDSPGMETEKISQ